MPMTCTKKMSTLTVLESVLSGIYCVGVRETGKFLYRDAVFRASTRWEHMALVTLGQRVRLRQVRDPPPSCRAPAVRIVGWRKSMLSPATLISRRAIPRIHIPSILFRYLKLCSTHREIRLEINNCCKGFLLLPAK